MGRFLDEIREKSSEFIDKAKNMEVKEDNYKNSKFKNPNSEKVRDVTGFEEDEDNDFYNNDFDDYEEVGTQQAQKPESFHHFILDNKYRDLENDIRGYKHIWDKETQTYKRVRKKEHCFTDEEAEMIVQKAQSNLSTDIKLSRISKEHFGDIMNSIYKQLSRLFSRIMEYRFGRFGSYEKQGQMKSQAVDIFENLYRRIYANYSMAIEGQENKSTHQSVRGQESLQSVDRDYTEGGHRY